METKHTPNTWPSDANRRRTFRQLFDAESQRDALLAQRDELTVALVACKRYMTDSETSDITGARALHLIDTALAKVRE